MVINMKPNYDTEKNIDIARSLMYYDKTIALLRCGADESKVMELSSALRRDGWFVYEITPEAFAVSGGERIAGITVICDAKSFPEELAKPLKRYIEQNGRVLIFGGPLFGSTDITKETVILEGISPLYKCFFEYDCNNFEVLEQPISDAGFEGTAKMVVCPNARSDGAGFAKERRCRMLPLVSVKKTNGNEPSENVLLRDDGRSGYAAFIMLLDTIGHMPSTAGTRLGNVSPITYGSEIAVIGISLAEALELGGERLIYDMIRALDRGVFIFEGGSEKYVVRPGEKISIGAKLINSSKDFKRLNVRFCLNDQIVERSILAAGQNFSTVKGEFEPEAEGDYTIVTELFLDGALIDRVTQEIFVTNGCHSSSPDAFVRVEDGNFKLDGKNWYMYGINYFPLYQVSFELNDYWRGAFDASNYIASEVEKDLVHIKALGMNTVAIRIDSSSFEKLVDQLRDFFHRCARLDLKVMMSFCNITNPLYFNEEAFSELLRQLDIADDPTLLAHDIFWEAGCSFFYEPFVRRYSEEWREWLIDNYGAFEAAEESFGEKLDRLKTGDVVCPLPSGFRSGSPAMTGKLAAFTRFVGDMVNAKWNRAVTAMKRYDSQHLYTNRIGHFDDRVPNAFISSAAKHLDFMCLEGYSITLDDCGFFASAASERAASYVSGGKPVTWVEYGISLPGMSGVAVGTKLLWDGERNSPMDWRLEEQRAYQEQYDRLFKFTQTKGSLPWFYAGGFRFTEHSDCGYVNPDGSERPAMIEYMSLGKWFKEDRKEPRQVEYVTVDPAGELSNWCEIIYGKGTFSKFAFDRARLIDGRPLEDNRIPGIGIQAAKKAYECGGDFEFITPGTGTTSENTPLELCGNAFPAERNGILCGSFKYLDGEFNYIKLRKGSEEYKITVADRPELELDAGKYQVEVGIGNLGPAKWLTGNSVGSVEVKVELDNSNIGSLALSSEVEFLKDGKAIGELELKGGQLKLSLRAVGRAEFGVIKKITIREA